MQAFEEADRDPRASTRGAIDFVIVGGGPTGVEVAGALSEMIPRRWSTSTRARPRAKVHLVDHGHALLKMFADKGARATRPGPREGRGRSADGPGVTEVGPGHVTLTDGSTILTRCVIWGGGLKAAPVAAAAGLPQGKGGRIDVNPDFTVAGFPGVLVIGDIANIPAKDGATYPQLGSVALQSGGAAAKTILADIKGETPKPFSYRDKGTMAMIGRGAAVAQVKGIELHGKLAFTAWLGVHAALMTGGSNRVDAFKSWAIDYFGKDRAPEALDRSGDAAHAMGRRRCRRDGIDRGRCPMTQADDFDVIIIGSGAGGGTLAGHLAPSGKKVLLLERGGWLPREIENWDAGEVFVKNRYVSADTWYDDKGKGFQPGIHYYVGGQTKFYGAALYRLRREDFGELRHHDGISPAWPITYDEFEPYYTKAEQLYEVHGATARTRRSRRPARRTRSRPSPTSRGSSSFPTTSLGRAITRSMRRAAYDCWKATCRTVRASAARRATGSRRSCRPSPTRRSSASGPPSSTRMSRC